MSTLAEIESAVEALPRREQETLLQQLERRLTNPAKEMATSEADTRQRWMEELRELRERNATGRTGGPCRSSWTTFAQNGSE